MKLVSKKNLIAALLAISTLVGSAVAWSGVAVIVHPSNGNSVSAKDISKIFLGKSKTFPDGSEAIPVDQTDGSAVRTSFVSSALKKNNQQIKSYWAQLLFTGKGTPPKEVGGGAEVKKLVSQNPSLIGYIDSSEVDGSVKVVHEF